MVEKITIYFDDNTNIYKIHGNKGDNKPFTDRSIGNRKLRKTLDNTRLSTAPPLIQSIKYADLIDNTSSILSHDPNFAKLYLEEKREFLRIVNGGDLYLYNKAMEYCNE